MPKGTLEIASLALKQSGMYVKTFSYNLEGNHGEEAKLKIGVNTTNG